MNTEYTKPNQSQSSTPVLTLRVPPSLLARIDAIGKERGHLGRSETIRSLISRALESDASRVAPE